MKFQDIKSKNDFVTFFKEKGFEVQDYDALVKIDDSHFLKFDFVDVLDNEVGYNRHRDFRKSFKTEVQYLLIIDKAFSKFFFFRDYGTPIKFTYDKTKSYPRETELALGKKLDSLGFVDSDFNESINNLFDVKEIVNKFYNEYRTIKNKLAKAIKNLNGDTHDYAQVILDRFIFLYFLQTKGILSKFYLSDLYYNKEKKQNFYRDYLKPLFFECLNNEHDSGKDKIINGINFGRIPYLNGGLFSEKQIEINSPALEVDDHVWDNIFKLLNGYEWVVEEEKGDSTTLTPAILGHIFEKSMTEDKQKGTGSFYTPEEITNYISKNTIYPFLQDRLNEKFGLKIKNMYSELLDKEKFSDKEVEQVVYLYEQVKKITVLDNACGSGAFLIAAQQILFPVYNRCIYILKNKPFFKSELKEILKHHTIHYYIKRAIITNNLYGVDIQEGAVDIAKLRLWLSMVSEMNLELSKIEPLPNIDYNILRGNSLIGFTKAVKTGGLQEHLELDIKESVRSLKFAFPNAAKELESLSKSPNIENLIKIKEILVDLFRQEQNSVASKVLRGVIVNIDEKLQEKLDLLYMSYVNSKLGKPIIMQQLREVKPFHWVNAFPDIIKNGNSGFDVMIGNPPYGDILSKTEKDITSVLFTCYNGEIASLFVEQSANALKEGGYFSNIITYAITFSKSLSKNRELIYNNFNECHISTYDRDKCRIFVGVTQSVSIIVCDRKKSGSKCKFYTSTFFREMSEDKRRFFNSIKYQLANDYLINEKVCVPINNTHRLPKIGSDESLSILNKILKNKLTIKEALTRTNKKVKIWIRTSGNYWYNSFDREPYKSSEIKPYYVPDNLKFYFFVLMNSNLFYLWFRIFGDGRHMNLDILESFPIPSDELVNKNQVILKKVGELVISDLFNNFDKERELFNTSRVKRTIDKCDVLLAKMYGFSDKELDYILNYDKCIRGGKKILLRKS